ncbi:MAG: hypothetical protein CSA62_08060 [Planctomycetota bacterium]|nr:MAG: hypothetical protein CSA62_08060 [Planctomycetota bacterium]
MRALSNFPLEIFGDRSEYPFDEILSFGPANGRRAGDRVFPYDIVFDASRQDIYELLASLPDGFVPDVLLFVWPDQDPIPSKLEQCPIPTLAFVSDYNLALPLYLRSWPFFDLVLCDRPGLQVLGSLPFARVEPICQFSFRPDVHHIYREPSGKPIDRDIDICFVGNLNPQIQRERSLYLERLQALSGQHKVFIGSTPQGEAYGRMLSRSRITFNRSIRGEINLRCFEAPACGSLLFIERENQEIRDYFEDGREVVLYSPEDLELKLKYFLSHEEERAAIAARGHKRVQQYRLASHLHGLPDLIRQLDRAQRPIADALTTELGRGELQLLTWASGGPLLSPLVKAVQRAPHSALARNQLAVAMLARCADQVSPQDAYEHLAAATHLDPSYLPARWNLCLLAEQTGQVELRKAILSDIEQILSKSPLKPSSLDGFVLPLNYSSKQREQAGAWCAAQREGFITPVEALHRHWLNQEMSQLAAAEPVSEQAPLSPAPAL